jgi:hypothetical protein
MRRIPFLFVCCALARSLPAQDSFIRARTFSVALLADRVDRRDRIISPGSYGGMLPGMRTAYSGDWTRHRTSIALELRNGALSGSVAAGSRERMFDGQLSGSYLRGTRAGFLGATLSAHGSFVEHTYGRSGFSEDYGLLIVSLAPTLEWNRGNFLVRGSVPVASLVSRPYSRLNATRGRLPLHFAGPGELRAATLGVSHTMNARRRVALRTAYTLELQSFAERYGLAAVENRFSAALLFRYGRSQ